MWALWCKAHSEVREQNKETLEKHMPCSKAVGHLGLWLPFCCLEEGLFKQGGHS